MKRIGKGKGHVEQCLTEDSSDIMGIYDTHRTTSESDREDNSNSRLLVSISELKDDRTIQRRQIELQSKALHDPTRILVNLTPPPPLAHTDEQVHPVPPV